MLAPWAEARVDKLMQQGEDLRHLRGIAAGKFSEYSQGDLVFYVERISEDKKMHKVFVKKRQHGNVAIINAEAARFKDLPGTGHILFLNMGNKRKGQPGALNYVVEAIR